MTGDFSDNDQQVTHYDPVALQQAQQEQSAHTSVAHTSGAHTSVAPAGTVSGYQQSQQAAPEDKNWRRMREENERYKREAEEYKKQLESRRGDDELVEYKQLREMQQRMEQQTLDLRLKSKFPDFDSVVNTQALQKLAEEDPELAYTLDNTPDMYAKAVAAYKMIKKSSPRAPITEDDEMFEDNQYKPRSTNSLNQQSDGPLSKANAFQRGLSKDQKSQLWAEMQEAIKNR